jgi:hypothetical protein
LRETESVRCASSSSTFSSSTSSSLWRPRGSLELQITRPPRRLRRPRLPTSRGMRGLARVWMLRGTWSAQAAPSPPPPWPKQEREVPRKDNISNIPTAMLREIRMEGSFRLNPFSSPMGTAAVMMLALGRIATLRPPPLWARPQGTRHPRGGLTQLLWPTEPLALRHLRRVIMPSNRLVRSSKGAARSPPATSGAERHYDLHHRHLCQALPQRPWHEPNCC